MHDAASLPQPNEHGFGYNLPVNTSDDEVSNTANLCRVQGIPPAAAITLTDWCTLFLCNLRVLDKLSVGEQNYLCVTFTIIIYTIHNYHLRMYNSHLNGQSLYMRFGNLRCTYM